MADIDFFSLFLSFLTFEKIRKGMGAHQSVEEEYIRVSKLDFIA